MIKATGVAKIEGSEIKPQFWGKKISANNKVLILFFL
jgi:hypothetical protein